MTGLEDLFLDFQGALEQGLGGLEVSLFLIQKGQVVEVRGDAGMTGPEGLFIDGQRPLVQGLGGLVVGLGVMQQCQVIEARGHVGMILAEGGFENLQGLLEGHRRRRVVAGVIGRGAVLVQVFGQQVLATAGQRLHGVAVALGGLFIGQLRQLQVPRQHLGRRRRAQAFLGRVAQLAPGGRIAFTRLAQQRHRAAEVPHIQRRPRLLQQGLDRRIIGEKGVQFFPQFTELPAELLHPGVQVLGRDVLFLENFPVALERYVLRRGFLDLRRRHVGNGFHFARAAPRTAQPRADQRSEKGGAPGDQGNFDPLFCQGDADPLCHGDAALAEKTSTIPGV